MEEALDLSFDRLLMMMMMMMTLCRSIMCFCIKKNKRHNELLLFKYEFETSSLDLTVFRNVTPSSLVALYIYSGRMYPSDGRPG